MVKRNIDACIDLCSSSDEEMTTFAPPSKRIKSKFTLSSSSQPTLTTKNCGMPKKEKLKMKMNSPLSQPDKKSPGFYGSQSSWNSLSFQNEGSNTPRKRKLLGLMNNGKPKVGRVIRIHVYKLKIFNIS